MNEGHSALLTLALLKQQLRGRSLMDATAEDVHAVRSQCVFTTHTPVPAGHDQFPPELVRQVLGEEFCHGLSKTKACPSGQLNMTQLALYGARYVNGVAMQHGTVSRGLFPEYPIRAITNGVHAVRWTSKPFAHLFDRHIPEWRRDNLYLRYAIGIPLNEIAEAHAEAKRDLLAEILRRTGCQLDPEALTVGFGRRAAVYKRGDFIFSDLERLRTIDHRIGPVQFVFGGKAHPRDEDGQAAIRRIVAAGKALNGHIPVVYLEDYDWTLAQLLVSGSDLWLNTPRRPQEASGTSGMKAALNGVPSLSVLDGWWVEGCIEGATGWAIGESAEVAESDAEEIASMYLKLEQKIVPLYYGRRSAFTEVMRHAISINGSFFNAQRMVSQYMSNAYFAAESLAAYSSGAAPVPGGLL
jgi:starch phosphorylase